MKTIEELALEYLNLKAETADSLIHQEVIDHHIYMSFEEMVSRCGRDLTEWYIDNAQKVLKMMGL